MVRLVLVGMLTAASAVAFAQDPLWQDPLWQDLSQELPGYIDGVPVAALPGALLVQPTDIATPPPRVPTRATRRGDSGYCYIGAHPAVPPDNDPRHEMWHNESALHFHPYPPVEEHVFSVRDDCYVFIGDPVDFGFQGVTYRYYGAHPLAPIHGGHWCFMIAGHHHLWPPFSSQFTMNGPWYVWQGTYTPAFWRAWPYYVNFYRTRYPGLYGNGRYVSLQQGQQQVGAAPVIVTPPGGAAVLVPGPAKSTVFVPVLMGRAQRSSPPVSKGHANPTLAPQSARMRPAP